MKFLCVRCDQGMKLQETSGPDASGSLAVVFQCLGCSYEVAMLTNSHETQTVTSLGVKIGPDGEKTAAKCPFSSVAREAVAGNSASDQSSSSDDAETSEPKGASDIRWTDGAVARLSNIPEFIRPMAKVGIEDFARSSGKNVVDEAVLDNAGAMFTSSMGMGE